MALFTAGAQPIRVGVSDNTFTCFKSIQRPKT